MTVRPAPGDIHDRLHALENMVADLVRQVWPKGKPDPAAEARKAVAEDEEKARVAAEEEKARVAAAADKEAREAEHKSRRSHK